MGVAVTTRGIALRAVPTRTTRRSCAMPLEAIMVRRVETMSAWTRPRVLRTSVAALSVGLGAIAGGCIDPESPLIKQSAEGCDEFVVGEQVSADLKVHTKVRAFMQAASDFGKNAD